MNDKVHLLLIDDEKNYLLVLETLLTEAEIGRASCKERV